MDSPATTTRHRSSGDSDPCRPVQGVPTGHDPAVSMHAHAVRAGNTTGDDTTLAPRGIRHPRGVRVRVVAVVLPWAVEWNGPGPVHSPKSSLQ
jgi:hypothetical protein